MTRMFLTHTWRAKWRSLLVLALMIGLTGGLAFTATAGARRAASSLTRFHDAAWSLDIFVAGSEIGPEPDALRPLLDGPLVEDANDLVFLFIDIESAGYFFAPTSRRGLDVEQGVLLSGRRADPDDPDEIMLSEVASGHLELGAGDVLELGTFSPAQAHDLLTGGPEPTSLDGPTLRLRVVGVVRDGFDLAARPADPSLTLTTPAFLARYRDTVGVGAPSHMVRLADVPDAIGTFTDRLDAVYAGQSIPSINVGQGEPAIADSLSIIRVALLALALVITVAGLAWIVAAAARHQRGSAADIEVLRAFGTTPNRRRVLLIATVAPGVVGGLVVAPALAIALSPLLPVGLARRVDPDLGLHLDAAVLAGGSLALLVVLLVSAAISAAIVVRRVVTLGDAAMRVPRLVDRAARALAPAPGTGVRFALYAPRRVSAPVRPALIGAWMGVIGLVAVAVVGASLQRLVDTPARWGATWDVAVAADDLDREAVVDNADIVAAAVGRFDDQVTVNGYETVAMVLDPVKGEILPEVIEGREPRADDEVALGRDTLDTVGVSIGDRVRVVGRSRKSESFRVVGAVVYPTIEEASPLADGVALSAKGGARLLVGDVNREDAGIERLVIRWAPGVDPDAALKRLGERAQVADLPLPPAAVKGLDDVRQFPVVAAIALAVLGVIATGHALFVTVRRRRLELGILSALGFAPGQRRAVIAVQATTVALVALVIGLPLGAVAGRLMWSVIADSIGVRDDVVFPLPLLAAGSVALVVALNLIAALPARSAGRLRVAEALRSE